MKLTDTNALHLLLLEKQRELLDEKHSILDKRHEALLTRKIGRKRVISITPSINEEHLKKVQEASDAIHATIRLLFHEKPTCEQPAKIIKLTA